jgi:hypothetical protein
MFMPSLALHSRRETTGSPRAASPFETETTHETTEYRPSAKALFMTESQRDYFRTKLVAWRDEVLEEAKALLHLREESQNHPDHDALPPRLTVKSSCMPVVGSKLIKIDATLIGGRHLRLL